MTGWAYYNEWDEPTAAWLRELIARGLVAPGEVDTRSITEVAPDDLRGFTQAHFFAGIGGWSHALRLAGWPDDRPVWTGSPPCQPFSMAGKRDGYADERHLAPAWLDLVKVCAPERLFGEQVSGAVSAGWLDALQHELEAEGYACGAVVLASCGVGAPNIRSRLYFAAERLGDGDGDGDGDGAGSQGRLGSQGGRDQQPLGARGVADGLADADQGQRGRLAAGEGRQRDGAPAGRKQGDGGAARGGDAGGVANAERDGRRGGRSGSAATAAARVSRADGQRERVWPDARSGSAADAGAHRPGPTNGFWADADWLFCRDGAWRPVEPGVEPLADGVPARMVVVCATCQTETRWINGASKKAEPVEVLQSLWRPDGAQAPAKRRLGGTEFVQSSPVLQSALLRLDNGQDADNGDSWSRTGSEAVPRGFMRGVQRLVRGARSSEPRQDLFCPVCERVGPHQCSQEVASRKTELRGYGNAINPVVAAAFIEAATE